MPSRRSRHADLDTYEATVSTSDQPVTLLEPRFSEAAARSTVHEVRPGERPDLLAHRYFGDAQAFHHLADENLPRDPDELATPGRVLRVPEKR